VTSPSDLLQTSLVDRPARSSAVDSGAAVRTQPECAFVVEETGFGETIPVGEGLLAFSSPHQAAAGVRDVQSRSARHARAVPELASVYFDSDALLARLVDDAMAAARPVVRGAAT